MSFAPPSPEAELAALRAFASELGAATSEPSVVGRALDTLASLFPGRALCVRVLDVRSREPARGYPRGAPMRGDALHAPISLTEGALVAAKLSSAVAASARLVVRDRWDSPFSGMATGFAIPLAAAGELYGVLDVGYAPSDDARLIDTTALPFGRGNAPAVDAPRIQAFSTHLAIALRSLRIADDALGLRDYQARLLENASALILGVDRSWRITVCNRALLELVGATRDDVLGRDVRDFISEEQRQFLTSAFAAALAGQHHAAITVALRSRKHGTVRTVWSIAPVGRTGSVGLRTTSSSPVAGRPGTDPAAAPRASSDPTALPLGGAAGRGHAPAVDAVVAIGQDMSQVEALQQQIVRAERLATLGSLAAGVVHELNNPLTSITVYAEYLVRKLEPTTEPGDVEKLRRIGASAQRILRFSRDLVQYARPSGRDVGPIDLASVVRQSVSICEHLVERGGIELSVELDPELPVIQAVEGQLEQVLINLITNAVHAVENGGRVEVHARVDTPSTIAIEVADSGPGVAEDDREKIFEPFFTTKPDGKGTGLGLPIVRNIVEQHHGEIRVARSSLGGAAFRVILPIL